MQEEVLRDQTQTESESPRQTDIHAEIIDRMAELPGHSCFRLKFFVYITLVGLALSMRNYSPNKYFMNPNFYCNGEDSTTGQQAACQMLDFCTLSNQQTLTVKLKMYCGARTRDRVIIQTMPVVGHWTGAAIGGFISDSKGRRVSMLLGLVTLTISCLGIIPAATYNWPSLMGLSQFLTGVATQIVTTNCLILLTRFFSRQSYEFATVLWFIAFNGIGQLLILFVWDQFPGWQNFAYVCLVMTAFLTVFGFWAILEDPIFLFDYGHIFQCKDVIRDIARRSKTYTLQDEQAVSELFVRIDQLFEAKMGSIERNGRYSQARKKRLQYNLSDLWQRDLVMRVLILGLMGGFKHLTNDTLQSDYYTRHDNLLVVGLAHTVGLLVMFFLIRIEKQRNRGFIWTAIIDGGIIFLFVLKITASQQTAIYFFAVLFRSWNTVFFVRLKIDQFPSRYQQTLLTSVDVVSDLGHLLSPFFIVGVGNMNQNPIVVADWLRLIIGTVPAFFLVERKIELNREEDNQQHGVKSPQNELTRP